MLTFDPDESAVCWLYAFLPLLVLAVNSIRQPSGRLLGTRITYSNILRAFPIPCALDALVLVVQCSVYCVVRRTSWRRALLLCCHGRFEETADSYHQPTANLATTTKMQTSLIVRLGILGAGITWLVFLAMMPGDESAPWTAAWGWLYVGSCVITELVLQVHEQDKWRWCCSQLKGMKYMRLDVKTTIEKDDRNDEMNDTNIKPYETDDPSKDPRLYAFHEALATTHKVLRILGIAVQAMFVCWAYLDLLQGDLNRHLLVLDMSKVQSWDDVAESNPLIYYLSLPLMFVTILLTYSIVVIGLSHWGTRHISRFHSYLCDLMPPRFRQGIVSWAMFLAKNGACVAWGFGVGTWYYWFIGAPLVSSEMMWVHAMLLVEFVALVLLLNVWFLVSVVVTVIILSTCDSWIRRHGRTGVALVSLLPTAFIVLLAWYALRFADSEFWWQGWKDALYIQRMVNAAGAFNAPNNTLGISTESQPDLLSSH